MNFARSRIEDMNCVKSKIREKAVRQKRHWIRLTRICNQRCVFCHDKENQTGGVLSFGEVLEELNRGRRRGCVRVIFSGGEPTLHPQLPQIIKRAKSLGYVHVQVVSNGRMFFYDDFLMKLKKAGLDEVTLSLHSHLEGPFEAISHVKGSYRQAMKGLFNALRNRFIVSIDIVINKINYKTIDDTLKFFMALGVSEFDLLHLIPFGAAWRNREDVYYPMREGKKYLDKAFALSRKEHIHIWTNRLPAAYLEGYEELIQHPKKLEDEVRGMEHELKRFIQTGQKMGCAGERCQYCFMNAFCRDIIELRTHRILRAHAEPLCLNRKNTTSPPQYRYRRNMSIYKFLDFFINYRYFVKSFRCEDCELSSECFGAQINEIRSRGFRILTPLTAG